MITTRQSALHRKHLPRPIPHRDLFPFGQFTIGRRFLWFAWVFAFRKRVFVFDLRFFWLAFWLSLLSPLFASFCLIFFYNDDVTHLTHLFVRLSAFVTGLLPLPGKSRNREINPLSIDLQVHYPSPSPTRGAANFIIRLISLLNATKTVKGTRPHRKCHI